MGNNDEMKTMLPGITPQIDGHTYSPGLDRMRLGSLLRRVFDLMRDGKYRTLDEIQGVTGGSQAAISARLRDFRKDRFGGYEVVSRRRGGERDGLFEYRLDVSKNVETYPPEIGRAERKAIRENVAAAVKKALGVRQVKNEVRVEETYAAPPARTLVGCVRVKG